MELISTSINGELNVVMITGMRTRVGSRVRGSRGQVQVTKFLPVTFPYPFGRVMGL